MTESRAGDILYLIAEDISVKVNNITINEQMINRDVHCLILKNLTSSCRRNSHSSQLCLFVFLIISTSA